MPSRSSSLREFALCYSRYPPTRACGWVVGSRPDGDAMTGTAGTAGEFPNRLLYIVFLIQKIIMFEYFFEETRARNRF